jgi:hypothetical protein
MSATTRGNIPFSSGKDVEVVQQLVDAPPGRQTARGDERIEVAFVPT